MACRGSQELAAGLAMTPPGGRAAYFETAAVECAHGICPPVVGSNNVRRRMPTRGDTRVLSKLRTRSKSVSDTSVAVIVGLRQLPDDHRTDPREKPVVQVHQPDSSQ